jgi:hypothetical protein
MLTRRYLVMAAMVVLTLSTASTAHGVDVKVDYDPTVDFSLFKTISWREGTPAEDPELENRIHAAIERELIPLGLREVREDPDLYIVTHAAMDAEALIEIAEHDYWLGYEGWKKPVAVSQESWNAEMGLLLVDLVDASRNQLIWRGLATGNVAKTAEKRERKLDKTMAQLFKGFPPKLKKK